MKDFKYSWQQLAKASFVGIATTVTFYLAKTTGLFSSWLSTEESTDAVIPRLDRGLSSLGEFTSINSGQRRLLQQSGVTIANPIPDQVIEVNQQYIYSFNNVFLGNYSFLGAVETGKNSLPSWLSVQPKLLVTYLTSPPSSEKVILSGNLAFVISFYLLIFDVSNTSNPRLLSTYVGNAREVALDGNTAFLADGVYGLKIINVSNPSMPQLLSNFSVQNGMAFGVAISGKMALVAGYNGGLQILNVSNISNPQLISIFQAQNGTANRVAISGNTAFVVGNIGLQIIDVSNNSSPQLLSTYPGTAMREVVISGNTAFIANGFTLQIFDISNTSNPRLLGSYSSGFESILGITISNNTAFIAHANSGLKILDVSNPNNSRLLASYPAGQGMTQGSAVSGSTVFVADGYGGLLVLDISQAILVGVPPLSGIGQQIAITVSAQNMSLELASDRFILTLDQLPQIVTSTISDQSVNPGQSLTLSLSSEVLFLNPSNSFLKLSLKLSNGAMGPDWLKLNLQPVLLSTFLEVGGTSTYGTAINASTAFVANGVDLKIVDISQLNNPRLLSKYLASYSFQGLAISGNLAFVADYNAGIKIFDVKNVSNPKLLSSFPAQNGTAYKVAVTGNTLFVADGSAGLQILDITNTSNPRLLSTVRPGYGLVQAIAVSGSTAFVGGFSGLQIIDVSNTSNPKLLSTYFSSLGNSNQDVVVSNNIAFLADNIYGLRILNVSNTSNPQLLSIYTVSRAAQGVAISGSTAFVADDTAGLQIIDVSNTSNPRRIGIHPGAAGGQACGITVSGNTAFLADFTAGLLILDLSQWQLTATPSSKDVGNYQLKLIATDELGGSAETQPFTIRVEGPPQFHGNISTQFAKVGQAFNYFVPQGLVTDPNFDAMVFTAKLSNGQALPSWLSFNAVSATFAGTPSSSAVGNTTILLSVTDNIAGSVNTTFVLEVSHAPVVNQRIADQVMGIGLNNSLLVPSGTFTHPDNLPLVYSAERSNGLPLPTWLSFNNLGALFSGKPNGTDAGIVSVLVTADDQAGGQASTPFTLTVEHFPRVNQPVVPQSAGVGVPYRLSVVNSFLDDDGDAMTYQAVQADGSGLPSWLSFNAFGLEFSGTPAASDLETVSVRFSATDSLGGRTDQIFNLSVIYFPAVGTPIYPQVACVNQLYQFTVPSNTFLAGSATFTYSARQSGGQALPTWLNLNGMTGVFNGTPTSSNVDQITITLIGTASSGGAASTDFSLTTTTCPSLRNSIPSSIANVNAPFALTLAGDTFDNGGMTLTLSAERMDHSALPNWLSFNPVSGVLAGVPLSSDVKLESLQVVARNPVGGEAVAPFNLTICYFPILNNALPTVPSLRTQRGFSFTVPAGTFSSPTSAVLQYQAQRADGTALPSWLTFNATQQQLSGTPGLTDLGNFNLQIIASDPTCGSTPAPMSLLVQPNYPPDVVHPLTNQIASVGVRFTFFAPSDTFTDRNNDPLNYTAAQSNGQSLPRWLHFTASTFSFSGTPGRGDTDAFSDKVLTIALTAHDDKSQTAANFNINVTGTSNLLLFIKIAVPIFSILTTGLGLYLQRGRLLNRCRSQRYQRLEDYKAVVGEEFKYQFNTPKEQIENVRVRLHKETQGYFRFFQLSRQALPGGADLPNWMEYDPETNELRSKGLVPNTKLTELYVQAKGAAGVTLEQFTLRIEHPALSQEAEAKGEVSTTPRVEAIASPGGEDIEMQTLQTTATTPSMSF